MTSKTIIGFSFAFLLVLAASMLEVAVANPLMPRMIEVTSPQNNQVCSTSSVWLNFTALTKFNQNFTSFSYSLDGQESITTDDSTS